MMRIHRRCIGIMLGVAAWFSLIVAAVAASVTTGSCETSGTNEDLSTCAWSVYGVGRYDKDDYMGIGAYYVSLPFGGNPAECEWRATFEGWDYPEVYYRMLFYEALPNGPDVHAESCPQEMLDSIPWPEGLSGVTDVTMYWLPDSNWWTSDNAVQNFYKVQTYGDIGGWDAAEAAL